MVPRPLAADFNASATLLVALLWLAHLALNIAGWSMTWSVTYADTQSSPPSPTDGLTELYGSTFWNNVTLFWDSGSAALAVLIVFGGLVQPIIKCIALAALVILPMESETRERVLSVQEATSKLSFTPFYVEAILLDAFAYKFTIPKVNIRSRVYIMTKPGLMCVLQFWFLQPQLTRAPTQVFFRRASGSPCPHQCPPAAASSRGREGRKRN